MNKKVIVVTGASSGIGAELCKKLGSEGHCIVLAARRVGELNKIASLSGKHTLVVQADVTKRSDVEKIYISALKKFGDIDVWINNAGRGICKKVIDLTDEDVDEMMTLNFKSVFWGIKTIVPYFQSKNSGHIINISSILGRLPISNDRAAYSAAKSAVNAITAYLRVDLRRTHPGINVSTVMPSLVTTDFSKRALYSDTAFTNRITTGAKPQTPEQVAEIIYELIKQPRPEIYTNPASYEIVKKYYDNVSLFEDGLLQKLQ